jgi:hypothetical protein
LRYFKILIGKILTPSSIAPSFTKISAGRTARELWWTSQELSPAGIVFTMARHAHISPGG